MREDRPLLTIRDLHLSFSTPAGRVQVLSGVDLQLGQGEVLGLVGESGSGKSVTAYSVMGLTGTGSRIDSGEVDLNGHQIGQMTERQLQKVRGSEVGIIFQDPMTSLDPVWTVGSQIGETLRLHTSLDRAAIRARTVELLRQVGLNEPERRARQYPHELSGGQRQSMMIAMALACGPKLLIADEPTTALDVTIQAQILELMLTLREQNGMAILLITHDLGVVAGMCERVAVMYAGRIVEYGTVDELFYDPRHEYTRGLIRSLPRLDAPDQTRLVPIEGTPVDLLALPAGCPFAPRCPSCMQICLRQMPPYTHFSDTHYSACWLTQKQRFDAERKDTPHG